MNKIEEKKCKLCGGKLVNETAVYGKVLLLGNTVAEKETVPSCNFKCEGCGLKYDLSDGAQKQILKG